MINSTYAKDAFKINGTFLEDLVSGYNTLNSNGREFLAKEFTTQDNKGDGAVLLSSRFPTRTITIGYIIHSTNAVSAFETLMGKIDSQDVEIIFNDESDKYLTGNIALTSLTRYPQGGEGEMTITCTDPFKYSVSETVLNSSSTYWDSTNRQWTNFPYNGTYKARPKFTVEFPCSYDSSGEQTDTSEYGYVGFANQAGKVLQFGDPNETDTIDVDYQTMRLLSHKFTAWGSFTYDSGLALSGGKMYGSTFPSSGTWRDLNAYCTIPTETGGTAGSTNFKTVCKHVFTGNKAQFGGFRLQVIDTSDGTILGEAIARKTSKDSKCKIYLKVNGTTVKTYSGVLCSKVKTTSIIKEGKKVTVSCGGKKASLSPSGYATRKGYQVKIILEKYSSKAVMGSNYVTEITWNKNNSTYVKDIVNSFQPNDFLNIDCNDASVLNNGVEQPSLGALGNDWEDFTLTSGYNTVATDFTGWNDSGTVSKPIFTLSYREVFI